jgi:hypothetical protein
VILRLLALLLALAASANALATATVTGHAHADGCCQPAAAAAPTAGVLPGCHDASAPLDLTCSVEDSHDAAATPILSHACGDACLHCHPDGSAPALLASAHPRTAPASGPYEAPLPPTGSAPAHRVDRLERPPSLPL